MKKSQPMVVTDHAVIRWMERANGVEVEAIRREIERKTRRAIDLGASSVQIAGFLYVLDPVRRCVVTVLTPQQRKTRGFHLLEKSSRK